jgi:SAM-dependent methyltransferase
MRLVATSVAWRVRVLALRVIYFRACLRTRARRTLEYELLAALHREVRPRRVLWIGVGRFTTYYPCLFPGARLSTIDRDPEVARWGAPHDHRVGSATRLPHFWPAATFDAVLCNGVYGWGLDTEAELRLLLDGIRVVLRPRGFLLFGWNPTGKTDPVDLDARRSVLFKDFVPARLSGRDRVSVRSEVDHLYEFFHTRDADGR